MKLELDKIKKDIAWLINQIKCFMSIFPAATTWSNKHSAVTGNKYLKDTLVWYDGFIYKCLVDNNGNPVSNSFYWEKVGKGWLLQQEQADWNATEGPSFIRNKPTSIGGGTEEDPIFEAWLATNPLDSYYLSSNPAGYITSSALSSYLTITDAATTYQPLGSYLTSISGLNISLLNNDSGYITSSSLSPYLTISLASTTYFPLPTGTVSQYIRGDGTLATFPTIPTNGLPIGGTAGQILTKVDATDYNATWQDNYADWTSVIKHTVKNDGTGLISKGTAVYVTGSNGTNMLVGKASNASEATSSKTMGLMQSDITTTGSTQTGFVITEGLLSGLNTASATAGDPVWLGVNGALIYGLANKPYAPAHLVFIGIVTKVSAGNGEIFVKVQNGFELKEIHDVDLITTTPVNGHILGFDGTLWVNKTVAGWLGFTPYSAANPNGYTSNVGTVTSVAQLTLGTSGTDLSSTVATSTTTPVITLNVPTASATNRGVLSSTDWTTFNNKQNDLWTFQRTQGIYFFEDFLGQNDNSGIALSTGITMSSSGTGAANRITGVFPNRTNQIGVAQLATGTTSTGNASIRLGSNNAPTLYLGVGTLTYETYVNIETLSTGTERYIWGDGLLANANYSSAPQGAYFIYDEGGAYTGNPFGASPNFKAVSVSAALGRTVTNTLVAVTAGSWVKLRIEINSSVNQILFYINDVLVATHTNNLPATTTPLFFANWFVKTIGTTSVSVFKDYLAVRYIFTNSR